MAQKGSAPASKARLALAAKKAAAARFNPELVPHFESELARQRIEDEIRFALDDLQPEQRRALAELLLDEAELAETL